MDIVTLATCHQGYGITGGVDAGDITGFDLTPAMLAWAEAFGLDIDDPTVYLTVSADADTTDDVAQAIGWCEFEVPAVQAEAVRAAHAEAEAVRAEAYGR